MVKMLDRKLLRDLVQLKGQVVTIALVVASGITSYVSLQATWDSLEFSKAAYYTGYRLGDLFVHLKRAPESVRERLERLPGVARAYSRITETVRLPLEGEDQPPIGQVVSLPAGGTAPLNQILLRGGRMVRPGRADEALLLTAFARRHDLVAGDTIPAVINGVRRTLRIVGLADSPEFIYAIPPGGNETDDRRFAVLWMDRAAAAPAFQLEGAFNDVVLKLQPGASEPAVRDAVDRLLDPYGGYGAVTRTRQTSNYILTGELDQLKGYATVVPLIFLGVAAFLVNVVLSRLVYLQRGQIAALKSLGYTDLQVGLHFLKLVAVVILLGTVLGTALGFWLGRELTALYGDIFHFPLLAYRLTPRIVLVASAVSLAAAAVGAMVSVRRVVLLPPAEAMRPPAPATYRPMLIDRLGWSDLIAQSWRIVLRELEQRPARTLLSSLGIAAAVGILVVGRFNVDAIDFLLDFQLQRSMREHLLVGFTRPVPGRAARELAHLPGVRRVDGIRVVPVRFAAGPRRRDVALFGFPDDIQLRQLLETTGRRVPLPERGLVLTRLLGEILGVRVGDTIEVHVLEGDRGRYRVPVEELIDEMTGLQGYMRLPALERMVGAEPALSGALLLIDPAAQGEVQRRLNQMPLVVSVSSRRAMIEHINEQVGRTMLVISVILTAFAATIAVGVVYNNARVALSTRSRDLASLRVLGFTRAEISTILLGEQGIQLLLAIPLGWWLGRWMTALVLRTVSPERYRFPIVISARSYAVATLTVVVAGAISALLVRHRVDHLDLIGVLKTRE